MLMNRNIVYVAAIYSNLGSITRLACHYDFIWTYILSDDVSGIEKRKKRSRKMCWNVDERFKCSKVCRAIDSARTAVWFGHIQSSAALRILNQRELLATSVQTRMKEIIDTKSPKLCLK